MQSPSTTIPSTRFCWICGRPISVENSHKDEDGNISHPECHRIRVQLRQAGSLVQEKPK